MKKVYKVPGKYIDFLRTVIGTQGTRLNLDVQDIDGNTIIGQEEWDSEEFSGLKKEHADKLNEFILIDFKPKEIELPPI